MAAGYLYCSDTISKEYNMSTKTSVAIQKGRGRPPINGTAMTNAERSRRRREARRNETTDAISTLLALAVLAAETDPAQAALIIALRNTDGMRHTLAAPELNYERRDWEKITAAIEPHTAAARERVERARSRIVCKQEQSQSVATQN